MMSLKFLRCQRGQAVVETTLSFILFMMVFYAVVEFSHLFYTKVNLQHAVSEAGRYMITGQGLDLSGTNPNARLAAVENRFCQNLIATGLSCASVASHFTVTCVGGCSQPAGGPGQTVTLTVTFTKPWLTAFFNNIILLLPQGITLTANATWKNEQYL